LETQRWDSSGSDAILWLNATGGAQAGLAAAEKRGRAIFQVFQQPATE
jgi:hypothetical protein